VRPWRQTSGAGSRSGGAGFQESAFLPYRPGENFVLPPIEPAVGPDEPLPTPPKELWLGYYYPVHGAVHVETMLSIAQGSGYAPAPGERILDLGCGAGRMIRHLRPFADRCEIWGADISAEHILWCKRNLSPPFHFATTTKLPHLPFEDRSFQFIYCGSLFTHIDDLADAWLLELKRILAPGGRLYVTIHDEHTIDLFERNPQAEDSIVGGIAGSESFRRAKESFSMFTLGRDDLSQVFYNRSYFLGTLAPMFDVLSVTEEAYFYQTAILLARKGEGA
jgi:SAM-dependent methyltransferase